MEENKTNVTDVQGTEDAKKERNPSASYTVKSFGGVVKKIETLKLANEKDVKVLKEIHERIVKQYMGFMLEI